MYEKNGMSCLADAPANLVDPSVITKSIPAALSIIDRNLRIVWMNTVQEGWFGPLGLLKGRHCYEVYERRKGVCPGCPSIKVFKYGLPECASIRRNIIVNVNGKEKKGDFKLTATPIKNEKGEVTQVLELVEDVTEEVRVEKTVKKKLSKVTKQLDFISELDKKFAYSHDNSLEEILKEAIELTPILFGSRICNLRLLESSRSLLVTKASKGLSKDYLKNTIMKVGEGIA
ncbi:MAG: hypothetical protein JW994_02040, partial [Candidatus Omnitrophica bacterium]|nr:hypothetical protein [Candidatus Omnitrophota bacterium]